MKTCVKWKYTLILGIFLGHWSCAPWGRSKESYFISPPNLGDHCGEIIPEDATASPKVPLGDFLSDTVLATLEDEDVKAFLRNLRKDITGYYEDLLNEPQFELGRSVLHMLVKENNDRILQVLVTCYGDDINYNVTDADDNTPSHLAAHHDNRQIWQLLGYTGGVFFDLTNTRDETPLHIAVAAKKHQNVCFLLEQGVDPNIPDMDGSTALHKAVEGENIPIVCTFLSQTNTDRNTKNRQGQTALHLAVESKNWHLFQALMGYGLNGKLANTEGQTPLDLAKQIQYNSQDKAEKAIMQLIADTLDEE